MKSSYLSKFDSECGSSHQYHFTLPSDLLDSEVGRFYKDVDWENVHSQRAVDLSKDDVECVIIGGGLSAITLAAYMFHSNIQFLLVDPHATLAERFRKQVESTSQRVMRSPYEHYVGCQKVYDYSLLDFAKLHYSRLSKREKEQVLLATAGHRSVVPVDLFLAHVLIMQIKTHKLNECHVRDRVVNYRRNEEGFDVELESGKVLSCSYVVNAVGEEIRRIQCQDPRIVEWDSGRIAGISSRNVLVVGAGQTAATVTEALVGNGCAVDIAFPDSRFFFRCVDSTPHFFRPAGRVEAMKDWNNILFPPSAMVEYEERFANYERSGLINLIPNAFLSVNDQLHPHISVDGESLDLSKYDFIVPCLGLQMNEDVPLGALRGIDSSIGEREYVIGANAKGAIGPVARNIDGHRVIAERITRSILSWKCGLGYE
ncbi:hypothetical protein [Arcanobacterium phocae]|uniref:hypothetical protein n=1 Tax=Arcanobacterium phocae TaxID=131112 RepID=UPI001C0F062B|nr:hypothetical protein [Arcanobacterium phocae]